MSDRAANIARLMDLAGEVCNRGATGDDYAELNSILVADGECRRRYLNYCRMHVMLKMELQAQRGTQEVHQQIDAESGVVISAEPNGTCASPVYTFPATLFHSTLGYLSSGWPVAYLIATVIFGIGVVIGSLVPVSQPTQVARQSLVPNRAVAEPKVEIVGRITGMVDCKWADESTAALNGAHVALGRKYAPSSGLMEITYDTGAKVILQGPVTYQVESPAGGYLSLGKLTARLEKRSEVRGQRSEVSNRKSQIPNPKFVVRTPTATVTDLGTEFGVEVNKAGNTTSHVFRGSVEVQPVDHNGRRRQAIRLSENESVQVENGGGSKTLTVRRIAVDPAVFVRVEQLPRLAEEQRLKAFRRWQAYSEELRRDPSLLAYYDFQLKPGLPSVLPNVAANGDKSPDGAVENATWSIGRMPGKHALLFNGSADYVQVNLPQKTDDLTLAAWINADSLTNIYNGILMSDGWSSSGQVHWQMRLDGRLGFTVRGAPGIDLQLGPLGSDRPIEHRWLHLAVVYDHAARRVWFYADGQRISNATVETEVPVCIGPARIGRWSGKPAYNLWGRIDELAIFGRALKPDEIQRMYEAGKPPGN